MALITSVAGFATFGVAARAVALTIQRRPVVSGFAGYGAAAVALGGVGYFVHNVEQRQNELLKERKEVLLANRERRLAQDA
ncbi:hypothetical protein BKA57DRAFT_540544 [Linnemannia elongata]|uniref:Uncharacterized protein n=1 Tax=Linnemannia elongata AG-77 TaxID=1314771 RepID=A0A197K2A7_9FUNG|nr:hypothetical protein BGZ88_010969 [Linnemannia elongata]OAQ31333.1 hypothetical protein K457DRAFT_136231 [Linnemannia elongata AG-77]KAF9326350.1 hypothetical protein BGZ91_001978 [Linnemannia elongata]KAG0069941.1 hypothetical protein BGZ89_001784 [Linnemannia elongata]KAG0080427.1 hypothetical protein BGZ90_012366 [Linnemannia elongata]